MVALCWEGQAFSRVVQEATVAFIQIKNERMIESHWRRVVAEIALPLGVRCRVAA